MTSSVAPPPRSAGASLETAARSARLVAALLVTGVCVRFAIAGAEHALGESAANFAERPSSHVGGDPAGPPKSKAAPDPPGGAAGARVPSRPPEEAAARGRAVRLTLSVSSGSPRSDVFVNGARVGNTPFLGDTSCKSGEPVRIEVVPAAGAPLTYLRTCRGGSIEISGPPP